MPWLAWLCGLGASLRTKGFAVRFPVRAHARVAGQVPSRGCERGNHVSTFLSLSPSFPLSLKINKIFFKIVKKKEGIFLSRNFESFLKIKLDLTFKWNLINKTSKQNRARNIKIKNKLTVTRGEVGGDSGGGVAKDHV